MRPGQKGGEHIVNIDTQKHPFDVVNWTTAPLRLEQRARLNTAQSVVFALLANHENLPNVFAWVQDVTVDNSHAVVPNGLGARRICTFGPDMVLEEIIVGWEPPRMYAYAGIDATHPFGMRGHVGVIQCVATGEHATLLYWQHYFEHPNPHAMGTQLAASTRAAIHTLIARFDGQEINT